MGSKRVLYVVRRCPHQWRVVALPFSLAKNLQDQAMQSFCNPGFRLFHDPAIFNTPVSGRANRNHATTSTYLVSIGRFMSTWTIGAIRSCFELGPNRCPVLATRHDEKALPPATALP